MDPWRSEQWGSVLLVEADWKWSLGGLEEG